MYKVRVNYTDFAFHTITDAMTFVGIALNSAMEDYDVSISKVEEDYDVSSSNEK